MHLIDYDIKLLGDNVLISNTLVMICKKVYVRVTHVFVFGLCFSYLYYTCITKVKVKT